MRGDVAMKPRVRDGPGRETLVAAGELQSDFGATRRG